MINGKNLKLRKHQEQNQPMHIGKTHCKPSQIRERKEQFYSDNILILRQMGSRKHQRKNNYIKTQSEDRIQRFNLPQLKISDPLIESTSSQLIKGEQILKKSTKNSKMLSELIEILQDGTKSSANTKQKTTLNKIRKRGVTLTENSANQFLFEDKVDPPVFLRGPKIIRTEIMSLCKPNKVAHRNIYSEERTRPPLNKKSIIKNEGFKSEEILTFYKPMQDSKLKSNTESIHRRIDVQF